MSDQRYETGGAIHLASVVIVLLALVFGWLILRDDGGSVAVQATPNVPDLATEGSTATSLAVTDIALASTTTTLPQSLSQVQVIALNASGVSGRANAVTKTLAGLGFSTLEPGNAASQAISKIYFLPGHDSEATTAQTALAWSAIPPEPMPTPAIEGSGDAQIVVIIGADHGTN